MKQGWEIKKLGEVVDIINGRNQAQVISDNGGYPIYGSAGNLMGYATKYLCEKGTTIIGRKGNISNPIYIEERFWNVDTAFGLSPKNCYSPKFINYLCQIIDFKGLNRGTTIPSLVKSELLAIDVPFMLSLPEQQRIVAILDEAFAAIAKAKAIAQQNLQNAKELFESYLQGVFESKGEGWEEKTLGEVCEYDKTPHNKSDLPYIGLEDIQSNSGLFIGTFETKIVKSTTFRFSNEHVLYGRLRPYLNKVLLPDFEGHCSTEIFPIKPRKNILDRAYLFHWLIATETMKKINATWTGATLPRANMNSVLDFTLIVPPLKTQQTIVQKLDALSIETKKLEAVYQQKINDLEELKKSILQKAFSGELNTNKVLAV